MTEDTYFGQSYKLNVLAVQAAERYGWQLEWRNPTEAEEKAHQDEWDCPSNDLNALYGVVALVEEPPGTGTDTCILWFRIWNNKAEVLRNETKAERKLEEEEGDQ